MAWVLGDEEPKALVHATWPLGVQPEPNYEAFETCISPGGLLLVCSSLGGRSTQKADGAEASKLILPEFTARSRKDSADAWLEDARTHLLATGAKDDRSLLIVKRL